MTTRLLHLLFGLALLTFVHCQNPVADDAAVGIHREDGAETDPDDPDYDYNPDEVDEDFGDHGGEGPGDYGGGGDEGQGEYEGESATELKTLDDFEEFLDNTDSSVVAAFTAKEVIDPSAKMPADWDAEEDGDWAAPMIENPALTTFNKMVSSMYNYRFAYTSAPELLEKFKASKNGGLFLYRSPKFVSKEHGDKPRERFPSDKWSESAVQNWLKAKAQPLVGLFSTSTKERYDLPCLVIFADLDFEKNVKGIAYVLKRARKAAVEYKGKLSIAIASVTDMNYELQSYGLKSKSKANNLMGLAMPNGDKYAAPEKEGEFSAANLKVFADKFLAGELSVYEKPEEEESADDEEKKMPDYGVDGDEEMDGAGHDEM